MPTMKAIKKRISSVGNTKKIMKAMDLVSASKLQKAKAQLDDIKPLYENIKVVMDGIKASAGHGDEMAFAEDREVKSIAYVVLSSDRGLCGGYNVNVAKKAMAQITEDQGKDEKIVAVGSKATDYLKRRGKNVVYKCAGPSEATTFEEAEVIGNLVASMYTTGEVDEVYLVYTQFESILAHNPSIVKLLPIKEDKKEAAEEGAPAPAVSLMSYDPDISTFIEFAVPMYLNTTIFGAMIESLVCEQASRMTSMDAATRNASEILEDLTLEYNRKRQNMITQEITEIVSGANAVQ